MIRRSDNQVALFPISRRADLVRRTACVGLSLPTRARKDRYWRARMSRFRRLMLDAGMRPLHVEQELLAFRAAVADEVERMRRRASRPVPALNRATAEASVMAGVS